MKKALLSLLFLFVTVISFFAQELSLPEPKGFIGISLGPAFAVGDYGDNSSSNDKSGYAKGGFHFNLVNFGYRFTDNLGICGLWGASLNIVDVDQMVKDLANESTDKTIKWSLESGNWSVGYFMAGGLFTIPGNKVDFDIKLMIGSLNASSPEMTIKATKGSLISTSVMERATAVAFAVGIGAGIRTHISPKLDLLTTLDYVTGKPKFKSTMKSGSLSAENNFEQSIAIINLSIGLAYRF
jgi:hypothetical protein